jgi:hypothetical protein
MCNRSLGKILCRTSKMWCGASRGHSEDSAMKKLALLPAAMAAMLAFSTSGALSQEVCSKEYASCADGCSKKSSDRTSCFSYCQTKNEQCSVKIFGSRQPATSTAQRPSEASEALAKRSGAPVTRQAPAPKQVQAPAPRQAAAPAKASPAVPVDAVPPAAPRKR